MISNQSTLISTLDLTRLASEPDASSTPQKNANDSFADTFARYATPPFSPWPQAMPPREDNARSTDSAITTRPTDQRRERRQRSRG